jgi:hypothetical protein
MTDVSSNRPADPAVEAAARGRVVVDKRDRRTKVEKRARARPQARAPPASPSAEIRAYSIPEFCRVHGGMSQAFFHALVAKGKGPKLMKVGARTFITVEAAAAWRAAQEAATEQSN